MIQSSRIIIIPVVLFLFLACSQPVHADGKIFSVYGDVGEPGQEALIMKSGNKETIILRIKLEGDAKDLGWVIPLPSYPEVMEAKTRLFYELERLTIPEEHGKRGYWGHKSKLTSGMEGTIIVETSFVGIYEVNKIRADDETALFNWLNEHNFKQEESVKQLLDEYIRKEFCFVAVKINMKKWQESDSENPSNYTPQYDKYFESQPYSTWLDPLRFEFESDKWFYPMKISSQNKGGTELIIWTASNKMMTFPKAKTQWAGIVRISDIYERYPSAASAFMYDKFLTRLSWNVYNPEIKEDIILKTNYMGHFTNRTGYYAKQSAIILQTPYRYLLHGIEEGREYYYFNKPRDWQEFKIKARIKWLKFKWGWERFLDRNSRHVTKSFFIFGVVIALFSGIFIGQLIQRRKKPEEK